jgi:hypothetical protein
MTEHLRLGLRVSSGYYDVEVIDEQGRSAGHNAALHPKHLPDLMAYVKAYAATVFRFAIYEDAHTVPRRPREPRWSQPSPFLQAPRSDYAFSAEPSSDGRSSLVFVQGVRRRGGFMPMGEGCYRRAAARSAP